MADLLGRQVHQEQRFCHFPQIQNLCLTQQLVDEKQCEPIRVGSIDERQNSREREIKCQRGSGREERKEQ